MVASLATRSGHAIARPSDLRSSAVGTCVAMPALMNGDGLVAGLVIGLGTALIGYALGSWLRSQLDRSPSKREHQQP